MTEAVKTAASIVICRRCRNVRCGYARPCFFSPCCSSPFRAPPRGRMRDSAAKAINHPTLASPSFAGRVRVGIHQESVMHFVSLLTALLLSAGTTHGPASGDIGGTVADSTVGTPLAGGEVRILQGNSLITTTVTDAFGRYVVHNLPAGAYRVEVRYLGYRAQTHDVAVAATEGFSRADFRLAPLPINLSAIEVATAVPLAVDTRTGNQIFKQNDYHGAPTNTTSQILQQSIVGAARAPTGEVHIRGQHAE